MKTRPAFPRHSIALFIGLPTCGKVKPEVQVTTFKAYGNLKTHSSHHLQSVITLETSEIGKISL
eukprot:scaffold69839_cov31-Prasinocladus_malaysianus.AAC.1